MNEWQIQLAFGYFVFIRILSNAGRANRALLLLARALAIHEDVSLRHELEHYLTRQE